MAKQPNPNSWYVKDKSGTVRGPLSEVEMRQQVRLASVLQVKQGNSAWYPANVVRNRIDELSATGIYVEYNGAAEGPYTLERAYKILEASNLDDINVRTGAHGNWIPRKRWLSGVHKLLDRQQQESATHATGNKTTTDVSKVRAEEEEIVDAIIVARPAAQHVTRRARAAQRPTAQPVAADPLAPSMPVPRAPHPTEQRMAVGRHPARPTNPRARKQSAGGGHAMKIGSGIVSLCVVIGFAGFSAYNRYQRRFANQETRASANNDQYDYSVAYQWQSDPSPQDRKPQAIDALANAKRSLSGLRNAIVTMDVEKIADYSYPPYVKAMGGRAGVIEFWQHRFARVKASGLNYDRFEFEEPDSVVATDENLFVIAPYSIGMSPQAGSVDGKSFALGISSDGGNSWKFVDGADLGPDADPAAAESLFKVLPELPVELKFPSVYEPEVVHRVKLPSNSRMRSP